MFLCASVPFCSWKVNFDMGGFLVGVFLTGKGFVEFGSAEAGYGAVGFS